MDQVYIQNCKTFSDAINKLKFELSVPEYYETVIPDYFRKPMEIPKPIVNGIEVEWDEYLETHSGEKPESFIPRPIYRTEDLNRSVSFKTSAEIVDLIVNNVPFEFVKFEDIETVIGILDGYYDEVNVYINYNTALKLFVNNMSVARMKLMEVHKAISKYRENTHQGEKKPLTLLDILNRMK